MLNESRSMWCGHCIYMGVTNHGLLNDREPCEMRGTWLVSRSSVTQPASALGKHGPHPISCKQHLPSSQKHNKTQECCSHIYLIMSACSFSSFLVFIRRLWHYSPFLTSLYTHALPRSSCAQCHILPLMSVSLLQLKGKDDERSRTRWKDNTKPTITSWLTARDVCL